jgi:glycine/D-amino acid oxidase-like deaminating enzyme
LQISATPYWWEDCPRHSSEASDLPNEIDVAVIGAGFTGLCAALVLARGGASVTVFDAGTLGDCASTLNGGMVGPSFHKLGVSGLKHKFGQTCTNTILKESVGFVDYLENFLRTEGIEADFVRTGRFRGAVKPPHHDAMARELEILKKSIDIAGRMIDKSDQSQETGSPVFHGGVVYDRDGRLHPAKYHDGLVQRARQAGVTIAPETPVTALEKSGPGYTVHTARGNFRSTHVAICTNGYTSPVTRDLRRRVLPLRSAMIATEPLDPALMKRLMPKGRVYTDSRRLVAYYRPSPDGSRILIRWPRVRPERQSNGQCPQSSGRNDRDFPSTIRYRALAYMVWAGRIHL